MTSNDQSGPSTASNESWSLNATSASFAPPPGLRDGREEPKRSSSFSNLAAALGSGLAESIQDSTRTSGAEGGLGKGGGGFISDSFFQDAQNDLSYARMMRHAGSRLLGSSPATRDASSGADASSLFASMDLGGGGKKGFPSTFGSSSASSPSTDRVAGFQSFGVKPADSSNGASLRDDSRLAPPKDLGVTVMEPSETGSRHAVPSTNLGGILSSQQTRTDGRQIELERGMQSLWSDSKSSSTGSSSRHAEEELRPYTWDTRHHESSRCLVVLNAVGLSSSDVRMACEKYGAIENLRSEFADKGIFFVSFYDMRASQFAAMELQPRLQRVNENARNAEVRYCVPLNSSSQNDESLVVLTDVPPAVEVDRLANMLSSFGAIRSLKSLGGHYGGASYVVEYHNIQDAKQVLLELESTQPWGPNVLVEVGSRNPSDRKRGRELLALIGRWRQGRVGSSGDVRSDPYSGGPTRMPASDHANYQYSQDRYGGGGPHMPRGHTDYRYDHAGGPRPDEHVMLNPDGRYSYMMDGNRYGSHDRMGGGGHRPYGHHGYPAPGQHGGHHNYYQGGPPHSYQQHGGPMHSSPYGDRDPSRGYSRHYDNSDANSLGGHSHGSKYSIGANSGLSTLAASVTDEKDKRNLMLDLDLVEAGEDERTSLMVRNIPNKYTQQMLLSEFTEHGHGPGVIDFFYLPIDFKNRCNRGYAFINFVDCKDILAFHRRYFGKHWRTFNSDKTCDITYARIQGKAAMIKRFENSALMDKDDEYKPLVFVSHGPDKGKPLPFPDPNNRP